MKIKSLPYLLCAVIGAPIAIGLLTLAMGAAHNPAMRMAASFLIGINVILFIHNFRNAVTFSKSL